MGISGRSSLPPHVSPSRVLSFLVLITSKRLLRRLSLYTLGRMNVKSRIPEHFVT